KRLSAQKPPLVTWVNEAERSIGVARKIISFLEQGIALKRQAVLFRAGYHSDQLEVELARRNIPFHKYGGLKFIEAAHVKDMLAFLRILENPYDEVSWFRVLLLLDGIGPQGARRIVSALGVRGEPREAAGPCDGFSPLRKVLEDAAPVPAAAKKQFDDLRDTIRDCVGRQAPGAPSTREPTAVAQGAAVGAAEQRPDDDSS